VTLIQLDELPRDAPTLVIIRGCPGQRKTTEANELKKKLEERGLKVGIFSTDDIFNNANGEYEFVPYAIGAAHAFLQHELIMSMRMREEQVYILDNTNLQRWEYLPYLREAMYENFRVFVLDFRHKEVNDNIHGVPPGKVKMMLENSDKPYPAHIEKYYAMNQDWYDWIETRTTNILYLELEIASNFGVQE
jgi:hypothetical protein